MSELVNEKACILRNERRGPRLYLMTCASPVIANHLAPGQFVHMKVPGIEGHVLRRPFSVYARDTCEGTIDVLYQVVGFGTEHMTSLKKGDVCELIGPVGHGWNPPKGVQHALLVGGGAGAPALYMLAQQLIGCCARVDVVLGAQTKDALVCRDRFERLLMSNSASGCHALHCATDDGSFGRAGFCTSLVDEVLERAQAEGSSIDYVATCGPEPLMKLVAASAAEHGALCEVSMEKRMACGIGACLSCVVETRSGKQRSCVDGPVFAAGDIVW